MERLLDVLILVCQVVCRDACRGAVDALAFVQFKSGYKVCDVAGLFGDVAGGT